MAIQEKKALHKAWAIEVDSQAKADFEVVEKANPTVRMAFVPTKEAEAIRNGAVAICQYFYIDSDDADSVTFSNDLHDKTVKQTVRANLTAYKNVCEAEKAESLEDYKKIYSSLKSKFEEYFALASEDALIAFYGDEYKRFAEEYTESHKRAPKKKTAETE